MNPFQSFYSSIDRKLQKLKSLSIHRHIPNVQNLDPPFVRFDSQKVVSFSSNDYLSLAHHPLVIQNSTAASQKYGSSSSSARLISGNSNAHQNLEYSLAQFKNKPSCLLFGSGFLANLAVLSSIPSQNDLILSDSLNHASIIHGAKSSKAKLVFYPHLDFAWVSQYLKNCRHQFSQVFLVTDSIFSIHGHILPLIPFYHLCQQFEAIPILDEAHSTGTLGSLGQGIENHFDSYHPHSIIVGTLSKTFASYGAFVCAKPLIIQFLINRSKPFIFSTSLPPATIAAAQTSLHILSAQPSLLKKLYSNIQYLNSLLQNTPFPSNPSSPIQFIPTKKPKTSQIIRQKMLEHGFFLQSIRPPTVPKNDSCLRISLSSSHSHSQIFQMFSFLSKYLLTLFLLLIIIQFINFKPGV